MADTYIANLTLSHLSQDEVENVETETTKPARNLRQHFEQALDMVLAAYDWAFARIYYRPPTISEGVTIPALWQYAFPYPPNVVAIRRLGLVVKGQPPEPYTLGMTDDAASRVIFANVEAPEFVCTGKVRDTGLFPPLFKLAVSWSLASLTCMAITKDIKYKAMCEKQMPLAVMAAAVADANEDQEPNAMFDPNIDPDWIRERGGSALVFPPVIA